MCPSPIFRKMSELTCPKCGCPLEEGESCPRCMLQVAAEPTGAFDADPNGTSSAPQPPKSRNSRHQINPLCFCTTLLVLTLGPLLVVLLVCESFGLFLPKPDFKVTVRPLEESLFKEYAWMAKKYPHESTIELRVTCETPQSYIPMRTLQTTVFVDDAKVGTIQWWPSGPFTIQHRDNKRRIDGGLCVGDYKYINISKQFLINGNHTLIVKSYQRRGLYWFIFGTVREKTDEYIMVVSDNSITTIATTKGNGDIEIIDRVGTHGVSSTY